MKVTTVGIGLAKQVFQHEQSSARTSPFHTTRRQRAH